MLRSVYFYQKMAVTKPNKPTKTRKPTEFAVKYTKKNINISKDHTVVDEVSFVSIPPMLATKP